MKFNLLNGLEGQEKKELEAEYKSSARLRAQYVKFLEARIEAIQREMLNEDVLNKEGWALSQASKIAEIKAFKKLISYL